MSEKICWVSLFQLPKHVQFCSNFNICGEARHPPEIPNSQPANQETSNTKQPQPLYQDLSEMPELGAFYDRTPELDTLKTLNYIVSVGIGIKYFLTQRVAEVSAEDRSCFGIGCRITPTQPETILLPDDTILLPEDLKDILQQQCDRLSELEKQVLSLLARESNAINLAKLLEDSSIPLSDLLNALQSLSRRCLIEQKANFYTLLPVVKQYAIALIRR